MIKKNKYFLLSVCLAFILHSCTAPRSVIVSGRVTPKKEIRCGANYYANIPTQTIKGLVSDAESMAGSLLNQDTVTVNSDLINLNTSIISNSLDPVGSGFDLFLRYGFIDNFDAGYRYASGIHVFDVRHQFLGSDSENSSKDNLERRGSVGLQYSSQKFEFPFGLSKVQKLLGYEMSRKDIMIPVVFSNSFGNNEKIGAVSYGVVYNHTFVEYGFNQKKIFRIIDLNQLEVLEPFVSKKNFASFGLFSNVKIGYKYAWLVGSLSIYYQNYGNYKLIDGTVVKLKGFTTIPSMGILFRLPSKKSKS